jgi:hypothetical protein
VLASLSLARELAAMGPLFTVSVFCYQPTPGSALADEVARSGSSMPSSLAEWADFDYVAGTSVFLDSRLGRIVDDFRFYNRYAFAPTRNPIRWGFHALARWRTAHHAYGFPVERRLIERLRPIREVS